MRHFMGVVVSERIAAGVVAGRQLTGPVSACPVEGDGGGRLDLAPAGDILRAIRQGVETMARGREISAIGVAVPAIVLDGVILEAPSLPQLKGVALRDRLREACGRPDVWVLNDSDALAAGVAASRGELDRLVRVWNLGDTVGYGRHPQLGGLWEGGHCTVTLDPAERYCGCGGVGHLEGILGGHAMRLRFLDLEPEEVFELAAHGDERCRAFVRLWHRALAAATGSSIHLDGPGKFYITGPMARFVDSGVLNDYLEETVQMSPLRGSYVEVTAADADIAVLGAAIAAGRAAAGGIEPSPAAGRVPAAK
jgi:predicted NBD/HSP70 family sugar kinase